MHSPQFRASPKQEVAIWRLKATRAYFLDQNIIHHFGASNNFIHCFMQISEYFCGYNFIRTQSQERVVHDIKVSCICVEIANTILEQRGLTFVSNAYNSHAAVCRRERHNFYSTILRRHKVRRQPVPRGGRV